MEMRLFTIDQLPRSIPIWDAIIEDLGAPTPERVARALGVGRSTVYRWNAARKAPRAAALALFWLTRWGRSAVHTQATNDAVMAVQLARSLSEERQQLREQLRQVEDAHRALSIQSGARGAHEPAATPGLPDASLPALDWPPLALPPVLLWPGLQFEATYDAAQNCSTTGHLLKRRQAHEDLNTNPNSRFPARDQLGGTPAASHASSTGGALPSAALRSQRDARPGTPASASVASLPSHGGSRPHTPAWSEPGAPPGETAFTALSQACMTPTKPTRRAK